MSVAGERFAWEPGDVVLTLVASAGQFANPWHDEIGRFAPKGYVRNGSKISRNVRIPINVEHADMVMALNDLLRSRRDRPEATGEQQGYVRELVDLSRQPDTDPEFVERLIKPASRAIADDNFAEAERLIAQAASESFENFEETFEVPEPETIEMVEITDAGEDGIHERVWETTTPEGRRIVFDTNGYQVTEEQAYTILSAATTAARYGKVDADVNIRVQPRYERDGGMATRVTNVSGFVTVVPGTDTHRTVNLTPELLNGNFDPGGPTPRVPEYQMASGNTVSQLRMTTLHEMGHTSLFEEALNGKGEMWYTLNMQALADSVTNQEVPLISAYGMTNVIETHAELFSEWVNTGGTTNNPLVRRVASQFNWVNPNLERQRALAAAGGPPSEPLIPYFPFPEGPVTLIDGPEHPTYVYGPDALVATPGQFANPWHDEIGRFAPKGTGRRFDAQHLVNKMLAGETVSVTGEEAVELVSELAKLSHPTDLTLVTVDGAENMFGEMRENGMPRERMPQVPKTHHEIFEQRLADAGVTMTPDTVDPRELIATQSELDGTSIGQMLVRAREGGWDPTSRPLWISEDGHILDGHHRWAAAAIQSAACDGCVTMPIIRIGMPMNELLPFAQQFTDDLDIERRAHGEPGAGQQIAAAGAPVDDGIRATDAEDGITPEQLADLPHGDGSAFEAPESD